MLNIIRIWKYLKINLKEWGFQKINYVILK